MSMTLADMENAVDDARRTLAMADKAAGRMASMLRHRLRTSNIPSYILKDLKKELANFNMHTGEWKP